MSEPKKMSKGAKIGIGVAIALVVAAVIVLLVWLLRKPAGKTDPPGPGPNPTPDPIPTPDPKPTPGPDPMNPTSTPTKGKYYIVKDGDSDSLIVKRAGFKTGQVYQARKAMRDHERNAWIPKKSDNPATTYDERALNLFQGWAPMVGHEDYTWAWKTAQVTWGGKRWPIVYVPTDAEVTL
jgi:hypothetical protein